MSYNYCGTPRGPEEHIRDGESCQICKDWMKQVGAKIVKGKIVAPKPKPATTPKPKPKPAAPKPRTRARAAKCGTTGGLRRHYTDKTKACEPCLAASREYQRARRAATGARKNISASIERVHGSTQGFQQHYRLGEEPCRPCKDAKNAYTRELRARKRAERKKAA